MSRSVSECKENNGDLWLKGSSLGGNEYGLLVWYNVMFSYSSPETQHGPTEQNRWVCAIDGGYVQNGCVWRDFNRDALIACRNVISYDGNGG